MAGLIDMYVDREDPMGSVSGYDATTISVDDRDVERRVGDIISKDSPLMQMARTNARQFGNQRGLLNSSMTAQAGESAAMQEAQPIAFQDAQNALSAKIANQNAENLARQFSASEANTARGLIEQGNQSLANIQAQGTIDKEILDTRFGYDKQLQESQFGFNTQLNNQNFQNNSTLQAEQGVINQSLNNTQNQAALDLQAAQAADDLVLQGLRGDQAEALSLLETNNALLMQTSASAANMYSSAMAAVGAILTMDLPEAEKQSLVDQQIAMLNSGLAILGTTGNVNLDEVLVFGATGDTATDSGSSSVSTNPDDFIENNGNPASSGTTDSGVNYTIPAGFDWGGYISQYPDLTDAYNAASWAATPEQWANELWISQAEQNGDPRLADTFGTGQSSQSSEPPPVEQGAPAPASVPVNNTPSNDVFYVNEADEERGRDAQSPASTSLSLSEVEQIVDAPQEEIQGAVEYYKSEGMSVTEILNLAADQYGGAPSDYNEVVNLYY